MERRALLEILAPKITQPEYLNDCWMWTGWKAKSGYARVSITQPDGKQKHRNTHCVMYELAYGPIPVGLEIDHTCHNRDPICPGGVVCRHRMCVNPLHLEAVTHLVNRRRASERRMHCKNGHRLTPENVYLEKKGKTQKRRCRKCVREAGRRHDAKRGWRR